MLIKLMHGWTVLCLLLAVNANMQRYRNPILLDDVDRQLPLVIDGTNEQPPIVTNDTNEQLPIATNGTKMKNYIVIYKETDPTTLLTASDATYSMAASSGGEVIFDYNTVLNGAAVTLTDSAAEQLNNNDAINLVFEDVPGYLYTTSWGIDRIDQNNLPLDSNYRFETNRNAGAGVNVCLIDSGIDEDYIGRYEMDVAGGENFAPLISPDGVFSWDDCEGHGTHVAGTIGSRSYGVAPGVTLWAARAFGCKGDGSLMSVMAGVKWCTEKAREIGGKWIVNMALGFPTSFYTEFLDQAIGLARLQGVMFVVAAGNVIPGNSDACNISPAKVRSAITVAASTVDDYRAAFSNFGTCVDIFAPGQDILSLSLKHRNEITQPTLKSGTSMAAPHVTGVAALLYQGLGSADEVERALLSAATPNKIIDVQGSPNLLVQAPLSTSGGTVPTRQKRPKQGKAGKVRRRH